LRAFLPQTPHYLNFILFNARSVKNKLSHLHFLLNSTIYNFIAICETWLSIVIPDSLIIADFPYTIIRSDRTSKNKGGGVCVIISHNLAYQTIPTPRIKNSNLVAIDIFDSHTNNTHRIITIYRPTTSETLEHFSSLIDTLNDLCSVSFPITILGDLNFPSIIWNDGLIFQSHSLSNKERMFDHFLTSFEFKQYVNFPTRQQNIIDLVLSNHNSCISDVTSLPPFNNSDHNSIAFKFKFQTNSTPTSITYNFDRADYDNINLVIYNTNWQALFYHCTSTDQLYNTFCSTIKTIIDEYVPKKLSRPKIASYPAHIQSLIDYRN
jgi:hypothetical protein